MPLHLLAPVRSAGARRDAHVNVNVHVTPGGRVSVSANVTRMDSSSVVDPNAHVSVDINGNASAVVTVNVNGE